MSPYPARRSACTGQATNFEGSSSLIPVEQGDYVNIGRKNQAREVVTR